MIRSPRRAPHLNQRPAEGMPAGGWAAADLNLPAWWYDQVSRCATGCEYPISGDQQNKQGRRQMNALTDPKGVKSTVKAIYLGGREHPLADLARAIDDAIREGTFQGLSDFDTARWAAHVVFEGLGGRPAEARTQPPRELTTYDGIEALPNGSVVLDRGGVAWQRLPLMHEKAVWYPATVGLGAQHSGGLFDRSPFIVLREGNER